MIKIILELLIYYYIGDKYMNKLIVKKNNNKTIKLTSNKTTQ